MTTESKAQQRVTILTGLLQNKKAAGTSEFTVAEIYEDLKNEPLFAGEHAKPTITNTLKLVAGVSVVGTVAKEAGKRGKPANRYTYAA